MLKLIQRDNKHMYKTTWLQTDHIITKEFVFNDFGSAIDFVKKIAVVAEAAKHHPDILIHSYNKVRISLYSHEEDEVTDEDIKMADRIDRIPACR